MVFQFNFSSTDRTIERPALKRTALISIMFVVGFVKHALQEPTTIYIGQAVVVEGSAVGSVSFPGAGSFSRPEPPVFLSGRTVAFSIWMVSASQSDL